MQAVIEPTNIEAAKGKNEGWSPLRLAMIAAAAIYLHAVLWPFRPPDMAAWQVPWLEHLVHYGPIGAFAHPFSNYAPAYLYLLAAASLAHGLAAPMAIVKALSVAGTAFLALACADLLKSLGHSARGAMTVFLLPSAIFNAAYLGQCDALWVGACVLAVSSILSRRTLAAAVWCGIAIAFKAQAAFLAPFIIGAMVGRRAPLWHWTVPALVFAASMIPARLAGWPAYDLLMVYPLQATHFDAPGTLANPWIAATLFKPHGIQPWYLLGYVAAIAAAVGIATTTAASVNNRRAMLTLAMLSATAIPFLLPKMLERYYFLGDVLGLMLALSLRTRLAVLVALAIQTASMLSHWSYMFSPGWPLPSLFGAGAAAVAIVGTIVIAQREGAALPARAVSAEPARLAAPHPPGFAA